MLGLFSTSLSQDRVPKFKFLAFQSVILQPFQKVLKCGLNYILEPVAKTIDLFGYCGHIILPLNFTSR